MILAITVGALMFMVGFQVGVTDTMDKMEMNEE